MINQPSPSKDNRTPWPFVWMQIAKQIAEARSHDSIKKVGCVIVPEDNTQILSIGFNGSWAGGPNERASDIPGEGKLIHAELNALLKCDFNHSKNKIMYVTMSPCEHCASCLINARIGTVIYDELYRDISGIHLLANAGIRTININNQEDILRFVAETKK